ncbi:MAG: TatD family hydrolase [Synergistaceae bacterium]|nr:TatD family hydrolase [Synergistaceae bacterium]MBQ9629619.1 TatD family hydrolase [Synergistaceae bacterium]MBR0069715.1 TatD family hydrolase [Synergistaceae bacterium]
MLIDTHCHLNSQELRLKARTLISRAWEAGVKRMVIVGCDYEDSCEAAGMSEDFSQFGLYASIGIHPHESSRYDNIPSEFHRIIKSERVVAVGEIGLDYHYDHSPHEDQIRMFELQLKFARENHMPVILHIRDAMNDAMKILRNYKDLNLLFHCYSGGLEYLDEILEDNNICAFGGAVTWAGKNSDSLREVVRRIPLHNIVLETDSPYMSPAPYRGKVNEPSYVRFVYEAVSHEKNITMEELEKRVEDNAERFFRFDENR